MFVVRVRYVLNYLPFGIGYKLCSFVPLKLLIVMVREIYRAKQIDVGFSYASTLYPNSTFAVAVYAVLHGTGVTHTHTYTTPYTSIYLHFRRRLFV